MAAARGENDDMHTMTRPLTCRGLGAPVGRAGALSTDSATSRRASSRRLRSFSAVKKFSRAWGTLSGV